MHMLIWLSVISPSPKHSMGLMARAQIFLAGLNRNALINMQLILTAVINMQLTIPYGSAVKNPPASAGDFGSMPGLGRSPGDGNSNPLQYSCLGNPMDEGAWWVTIHGVSKSQT